MPAFDATPDRVGIEEAGERRDVALVGGLVGVADSLEAVARHRCKCRTLCQSQGHPRSHGPTLLRIDPERNATAASITIKLDKTCPAEPPGCGEAAAGDGAVWITHATDNTVSRIDPGTNAVVATIDVGAQPRGVAVSPGAVWVGNSGGPTVSRIDSSTNRVVATIRVGPARAASDLMSVAAGGDAVWVGVPNLNAVVRIDPATNAVVSTIRAAGQTCGFLAADQNAVWAAGAHCDSYVARLTRIRIGEPVGSRPGPWFRSVSRSASALSGWRISTPRRSSA